MREFQINELKTDKTISEEIICYGDTGMTKNCRYYRLETLVKIFLKIFHDQNFKIFLYFFFRKFRKFFIRIVTLFRNAEKVHLKYFFRN